MQSTRLSPVPEPILSLEDIVARTSDLPTMSNAAVAVMRETQSANGSAQSVARCLNQDTALTVRVLRLANSAYYGLSRKVSNASEAVVILGMRNVRNLAVLASSFSWMSRPLSGYAIGPKELWKHSVATATAAQVIADKYVPSIRDEAFTAGLLHNLGKVAMSIWLENKLGAVLAIAERENLPFDAVERKVFGYDHCDVGGFLAENWNLPADLVEVVRFHHRPDDCEPTRLLVDCVHIADYLSSSMGYGLGGDGLRYSYSSLAVERLNLSNQDLEILASDFMIAFEKQERLMEDGQA